MDTVSKILALIEVQFKSVRWIVRNRDLLRHASTAYLLLSIPAKLMSLAESLFSPSCCFLDGVTLLMVSTDILLNFPVRLIHVMRFSGNPSPHSGGSG